MEELNEKIYGLLAESTEDRTILIQNFAEEIGRQIVKILIEKGLLSQN